MRRDVEGRAKGRDRKRKGPLPAADRERVEDLVHEEAETHGLEVWRLRVTEDRHIHLTIEAPGGTVTLDDCVAVNHGVQRALEAAGLDPGDFATEVESPGMNRPLLRPSHYERFAGWPVKLRLSAPVAGRTSWKGTIASVDGRRVTLEPEDGEAFTFDVGEVASCNLDPRKPH